jgi:hypothetical protein
MIAGEATTDLDFRSLVQRLLHNLDEPHQFLRLIVPEVEHLRQTILVPPLHDLDDASDDIVHVREVLWG